MWIDFLAASFFMPLILCGFLGSSCFFAYYADDIIKFACFVNGFLMILWKIFQGVTRMAFK
jgi:hypothetical protein